MTDHPVQIIRRMAVDAAEAELNTKTAREKRYYVGQMQAFGESLQILRRAGGEFPAGVATKGFTPLLDKRGEQRFRAFLGGAAADLMGD